MVLSLASAVAGQETSPPLPEGNEYVRSILRNPRAQDTAINDYSYDLEEIREDLDKKGRTTERRTQRSQVYFVQKRPVRRLVSKNGVPLSAREQAEVDRKAEEQAKAIAEGRTVSEQPGIRLSLMLDSFEFETLAREVREGRPTLVFAFRPKSTATKSGASRSDALSHILEGRVYIDEGDRRVAAIDATSVKGQSAGIATGVKVGDLILKMEFTAVEDGVWLPRRVETTVAGRAFFFKTFRTRRTTLYTNYRKFRVDTEERPIG